MAEVIIPAYPGFFVQDKDDYKHPVVAFAVIDGVAHPITCCRTEIDAPQLFGHGVQYDVTVTEAADTNNGWEVLYVPGRHKTVPKPDDYDAA